MEPERLGRRRTSMRSLGTALLTVLTTSALLTGCGDRTDGSATPDAVGDSSRPATAEWHGCTADQVKSAGRLVARADLEGSGTDQEVRLIGPGDAPCVGLVTVVDGRVSGTDLDGLVLDPGTARVVHLAGTAAGDSPRDLLLVGERPHPRGGVQSHLFAIGTAGLAEVTMDGHPVLPFVATDGGGAPATATCTPDGGIAVITTETHKPPGIVLAWDVSRTAYAVDGTEATRTGSSTVREAAADPTLRQSMPELYDGRLFADCSSTPTG